MQYSAEQADPLQHQVGQKTSPADSAPEFSARTLPAGTAPAKDTFTPNPQGDDAIPGQANNPDATSRTAASDTIGGSTSADVHTGLGHPGSGQTSTELRHGGEHTATKSRGAGVEGLGVGPKGVDREMAKLGEERGFDAHGSRTEREHNTSLPGAENVPGATAEDVAAERK